MIEQHDIFADTQTIAPRCEVCGLLVEDGNPGPVCRRCRTNPRRAIEQADLTLASFVARQRAAARRAQDAWDALTDEERRRWEAFQDALMRQQAAGNALPVQRFACHQLLMQTGRLGRADRRGAPAVGGVPGCAHAAAGRGQCAPRPAFRLSPAPDAKMSGVSSAPARLRRSTKSATPRQGAQHSAGGEDLPYAVERRLAATLKAYAEQDFSTLTWGLLAMDSAQRLLDAANADLREAEARRERKLAALRKACGGA